MDKLNTGEQIAGISGIALILIMFIFDWFGFSEGPLDIGFNAWESFGVIDLILFLAAIAGIGLAVLAATQSQVNMPVAASAIAAGLGILATILVLYRIINPPDFGASDFGLDLDADRSIGVFLGLIAAAGVAYGGWRAMESEGTSFGQQADRLGDDAPPPPPPPPASQGPAA